MLTPRLESVVAEKKGEVLLAKVDIDENTDLALDYQVLLLLEQFKQKLLICWKIPHCTVQVTLRITLDIARLPRVWFCMWKIVGWFCSPALHFTCCVLKWISLSLKKWYSGMAGHHFCHFSRFNLRCALFCSCWLWKTIFFNIYFRSHLSDISCDCTGQILILEHYTECIHCLDAFPKLGILMLQFYHYWWHTEHYLAV